MKSFKMILLSGVFALALTGCDEDTPTPTEPATEWPADQLAILVPEDAPDALRWTGADLQAWIEEATGGQPDLVASISETDARFFLLLGSGDWECPALDAEENHAYRELDYQGHEALAFCGGGLLGQQYAAYTYLFDLGFRFVHPEQTLVPTFETLPPGLPVGATEDVQSPGLPIRGFHLHTQHPLELLEAVLTDDPAEVERAYRFVDWNLRNRQNILQWILLNSVPEDDLLAQAGRIVDYAHQRGMMVSAVSSFNEEQQNAHTLIDTDDKVDDVSEIRAGLDRLMTVPWDHIMLHPGSSEFSETDDVETVEWMDEMANHLGQIAPGTRAYMLNHVPAGTMAETYEVNFYDLPQFAVPEMGVYVHTTMNYGLEGPAPCYGNADFGRLTSFLLDQVDDRNIIYYPESAWWLTFDNAIPLSPAMYFRVRSADIRFIAGVQGVQGHITFSSGWEWGYWLTDHLIAHQTWQPDQELGDVFASLLAPLPEGAADIATRMAESEWDALVEDRLLPFLTGEDLPTEIGYRAGIIFHLMAPGPSEIMEFDEEALGSLSDQLDDLEAFCEELDGFTAEWAALLEDDQTTAHNVVMPQADTVPPRRPTTVTAEALVEELHHGTAITGHRCWNAVYNFGALVSARSIELEIATDDDPAALLSQAAAETTDAAAIVASRETAYRYEEARVYAHEDTSTEGVDNLTDYPYRVNGRTHVLFFWHRRDRLTAEAVSGSSQSLIVEPQQILGGGAITVDATEAGFDAGTSVTVDWGDGTDESADVSSASFEHTYDTPSQLTFSVTATAEGTEVTVDLPISIARAIYSLPQSSLVVIEPEDPTISMVLRPFIPNFLLGFNDGEHNAPLASLSFDRDGDFDVDYGTVIHLPAGVLDGNHVTFEDFNVDVPVESSSGRLGTIFLMVSSFSFDIETNKKDEDTLSNGRLAASVSTEELISLVLTTGVFEREGVVAIICDIFGCTADNLPESLAVVMSLEGTLVEAMP